MRKFVNFTKRAVKWYLNQTMMNNLSTPSGMIPYNVIKKYNETN